MTLIPPPPSGIADRRVRLAVIGSTLAAFNGFALALFAQWGGPPGAILSVVCGLGIVASTIGVALTVQASRHAGRVDVLQAIATPPDRVTADDSGIEDLIDPNGHGRTA